MLRNDAYRRGPERVLQAGVCPTEKPSLILVCAHCAGQFRVQDSAIADTETRVRCPHCSKVFIVNAQPKGDSAPGGAPASKGPPPASRAASPDGGERGKAAPGSNDRLAAARDAVDDLLTRTLPPCRRRPQQPVRTAPRPRAPTAVPSPSPAPSRVASPPAPAAPAVPPAEARPVASETLATMATAWQDLARQWLESGLEALAPWMRAAAGMPVAVQATSVALLLGLLVAVVFWPDGDAAEATRPDAAVAGLDRDANTEPSDEADAGPIEPARRPSRMGGWSGVVGTPAETPEAVAPPAAPARPATAEAATPAPIPPKLAVTSPAPKAVSETPEAPTLAAAPAKVAPTPIPQKKTVKTTVAKPPPAPKAPAKAAATSRPRTTTVKTTTAKPRARSTATVPSTARTKPSATSTTRSPTQTRRAVTRTPVSQETISSESTSSQQQGEGGWVVEY